MNDEYYIYDSLMSTVKKPKVEKVNNTLGVYLAYNAFKHAIDAWLELDIPVIIGMGDIEKAKLIIFSGGEDISPSYYNERNLGSDSPNSRRDSLEFSIYGRIDFSNTKVLGICRGLQLINIARGRGGSLHQNLGSNGTLPHNAYHELDIVKKSSMINKYFGGTLVNSMHHQGINNLGFPKNSVVATHKDLIEGIETPETILVQFHPEFMNTDNAKAFGKEILAWSGVK